MLSEKDRQLRLKLTTTFHLLNEKQRRILAAAESKAYGRGGISKVSKFTGLCRQTIYRGLEELSKGVKDSKIRSKGGGRKKKTAEYPELVSVLESLMESSTRGDPESPLKWSSKSVRNLSEALNSQGYNISPPTVASILHELDYSLQANRKVLEGKKAHADRNEQFEFINNKVKSFLRRGLPVISVDTKKKEILGNYVSKGKEWSKKKNPIEVLSHDFPDPEVPRVIPYGVYDLSLNAGWVNVGVSADIAEFAVSSIKKWWRYMGKKSYPNAAQILICADSEGSNGYRLHLWKYELQKWCDVVGLKVHVCHFPPGTSKWNKIEHRLFSYISKNWRGRPLINYMTVVNLISKTKTKLGLKVKACLDRRKYKKGKTVSKKEMESIKIKKEVFHGEWNYKILPH